MSPNVTEEAVDVENTFTNFRLGRRPKSPDDVFVLGPMIDHPNVILNVAYGSHGFRALPGGLILKSLIENDDEAYNAMGKDVMDAVKSSRMFI
jgi:glycine/D-amino acid oxidase-like deaminating enzyme